MQVAQELKVDEDVILQWPPEKFERWVAFFRIQRAEVEKAQKQRR